MKILVVDDEKLLVKGIKFNLENDGYEVITGSDGQEALEIASREYVDLIILDLMMPRMDGLEACQRIREFSDVPIMMLTAKADDMDKLMGFEHGCDEGRKRRGHRRACVFFCQRPYRAQYSR